jgi:hypothetical protein
MSIFPDSELTGAARRTVWFPLQRKCEKLIYSGAEKQEGTMIAHGGIKCDRCGVFFAKAGDGGLDKLRKKARLAGWMAGVPAVHFWPDTVEVKVPAVRVKGSRTPRLDICNACVEKRVRRLHALDTLHGSRLTH